MSRKCVPCREDLGLLIMRTATMIRRKADSNVYMNKIHKITGSDGFSDIWQNMRMKMSTRRI